MMLCSRCVSVFVHGNKAHHVMNISQPERRAGEQPQACLEENKLQLHK